MKKKAMVILWPSFIVAAGGAVIMFSLMDPVDMRFIGPLELGRKAGYTLGFLFTYINAVQPLVIASQGKPVFDGYIVAMLGGP